MECVDVVCFCQFVFGEDVYEFVVFQCGFVQVVCLCEYCGIFVVWCDWDCFCMLEYLVCEMCFEDLVIYYEVNWLWVCGGQYECIDVVDVIVYEYCCFFCWNLFCVYEVDLVECMYEYLCDEVQQEFGYEQVDICCDYDV